MAYLFQEVVAFAGVQGTGKSLTAKAIAHDWQLPLLRLDFGRLFAGIVGESESRVREMIRVAEALSPCIVWIDEIDKSFNQSEGKGDSGTTNRVLATFLKTQPKTIIIVASEIDIPEEIRELITILDFNLPDVNEIRQELNRLLELLNQNLENDDLESLVRSCQGLSIERIRRVLSKIIANNQIIDSSS